MEKISITRALSELKLLDKRIVKETDRGVWVDFITKRDTGCKKSLKPENQFIENEKALFQSINDLIARRSKMKNAINISNVNTTVKGGVKGEEITVSEAIEKKNAIEYDKKLLDSMKNQYQYIRAEVEEHNELIENKLTNMMEKHYSKDIKLNDDDYETISKPFMEKNKARFVDPLDIKNYIEKIEKEIDEFESKIDFLLSESNSRTEIEID